VSVPKVRALAAQDGPSARELVHSAYGGTCHLVRTLELLKIALTGSDPECLGMVSTAGDKSVDGLLFYGSVGGAAGLIKVHVLAGAIMARLTALLGSARDLDSFRGARMFMCELSDAPEHARASAALIAFGFTCEASIADYFADGLTLNVLVQRRSGDISPRRK